MLGEERQQKDLWGVSMLQRVIHTRMGNDNFPERNMKTAPSKLGDAMGSAAKPAAPTPPAPTHVMKMAFNAYIGGSCAAGPAKEVVETDGKMWVTVGYVTLDKEKKLTSLEGAATVHYFSVNVIQDIVWVKVHEEDRAKKLTTWAYACGVGAVGTCVDKCRDVFGGLTVAGTKLVNGNVVLCKDLRAGKDFAAAPYVHMKEMPWIATSGARDAIKAAMKCP